MISGNGISFGSLRMNGGRVQVEAIHVDSCSFKETQNRARIKTWQGGSGHARNITFNSIKFYDTENPIIIDQYYRPQNRLIRFQFYHIFLFLAARA